MSHDASLENLKQIGIQGAQYLKTLTSSVTTAWGVKWDETYIARDLLQNFFDANRECLKDVIVKSHGTTVEISAPRQFSQERLFYLGSEKTSDDVGQYGEGFKAAAVCLLRDFHVTPIARSGYEIVCLRISEDAVEGTAMKPIVYDFFRSDQEVEGTILYLIGCRPQLAEAVSQGMNHFYHEDNPLIGELLWSNGRNDEFAIHESRTTEGHVFYRNLKRGEVNGIPIVLVINKEYQTIEKKIGKDRDRNSFGPEMMDMFFNHFARHGFKYDYLDQGKRIVLEKSKECWPQGHGFLSEIAKHIGSWRYPNAHLKDVFEDKYYSRCGRGNSPWDLEISKVENQWKSEGKIPLPQYFHKFGVLNADHYLRELNNKAIEESKEKQSHPPTPEESKSIQVLTELTNEFAPEIMAIFRKRKTTYTVAETDVLLGQLKSSRAYKSEKVFLAASVFESDLAHALAVFMHEHAHIFGHDGSRGFTDALTELLETVIRHRNQFDRFEGDWETARAAVLEERKGNGSQIDDIDSLESWIAAKSENELREILKRLPAASLRNLMSASAQKGRE